MNLEYLWLKDNQNEYKHEIKKFWENILLSLALPQNL